MSLERYDSLSLLSPIMRAMALEFIARLVEQDIHFKIIETWRTEARHKELLVKGVSWTANSKHLRVRELESGEEAPASDAIDVAPYELWQFAGADKLLWDADHPQWLRVGVAGEVTGLRWGGRWAHRDCSHFELEDC